MTVAIRSRNVPMTSTIPRIPTTIRTGCTTESQAGGAARRIVRNGRLPPRTAPSAREGVARAGVGRRVPQLRQGPGLDLADPLTREVEELAHLFERARLTPVEPEAQGEDLALALVERSEQLLDLVGQEGSGGDLERRLG